MVLKVPISPDVEAKLRRQAEAAGVDLETYAARSLANVAARPTDPAKDSLDPSSDVADMSEEELSEFIESEIHAMRAEKRARPAQ